jgi:choice-of-anchor C domain-containing protein
MKRVLKLAIGLVLFLVCVGTVSANLVTNGGFESPAYQNQITTLTGSQLSGWTIDKGDVQVIKNTFWTPAEGIQSLDMSGTTPGNIRQTISTEPGATYTMTFRMAGNPDGNGKGLGYELKELEVYWDGTAISPTYTFDTTGKSRASMGWVLVTIPNLKATKSTTEIAFVTKAPAGAYGIALDDISVEDPPTPAPEFPSLALPVGFLIGFAGIIMVIRNSKEN